MCIIYSKKRKIRVRLIASPGAYLYKYLGINELIMRPSKRNM